MPHRLRLLLRLHSVRRWHTHCRLSRSHACLQVQAKVILSSGTKEDESFSQANQTATEAFSNIRTIAAFSMEGQVSGALPALHGSQGCTQHGARPSDRMQPSI